MKPSDNDETAMMNHSSSDSDIELIPLEPDIRSGRSTSIHVRPCEIPASAWTDDIPIKSSIDKSMESERETFLRPGSPFLFLEDDVSSCESDDATLVSSSGSGSEATPPQPTIESARGTLIQVGPYEESCSSTDSHELLIESAVDDVLTSCFGVGPSEEICSRGELDDIHQKSSSDETMERSEEPIEEICSSSETDHISLSSVSDCVSEISLAAEPQLINALPASVSKRTPFLLTDQHPVTPPTRAPHVAARLTRADETHVDETQGLKKGKTSLRKRFLSWLLPKCCVRK
ncbi:hypothetical protein DPEC_G00192100 [Dallia pectoralis]|uniref:Uncharacterized protein n=1 Tax=Dallia pectoralis TaxID=75939 RepID=A0ACC2GCL2_DALPE|nr:hypothetical protein DPEC_G00192100 [Dallia pectoralis]